MASRIDLPFNPKNEFQRKRGPRHIWSQCPRCEAEKKDREKRELETARAAAFTDQFDRANIPGRYHKADIRTIKPLNQGQANIIGRCVSYIQNFSKLQKLGTSLVFTGNPGTGKTLIALGMVRGLIEQMAAELTGETVNTSRQWCRYVNIYDLFASIKATYNRNSDDTEAGVISSYTSPDLLILDEVGVQAGTDYESMLLFRIINKRYENLKPTILISNLTESDLTEYIGHRTIDRFYENHGAVFVFNWESARRKRGA